MAQEIIEKGTDLLEKKMPKKALDQFKKATEIDPNSTEAWFKLGFCYALIKKNKYAVKSFEKVLKLNPNHTDAWYFMGVEYEVGNKYREALECYEAVLTLNPNHALAWFQKGVIYGLKKKYRRAAQFLEKSIDISPNSDSLRLLGAVYKDLGETKKAKGCFQQLYEMEPNEKEKQKVKKYVKQEYGIKL